MFLLEKIEKIEIENIDLDKCNANTVVYALSKIGQLHNRFMLRK